MRFEKLKNNYKQRQPVGLVLHIGEAKTDPKRPGKAIDYFRATGHYAPRFRKEYPGQPKVINVFFPTKNMSKIAQIFEEYRNSGGVTVARLTTDWTQWNVEQEQRDSFEIFDFRRQCWMSVGEQVFDSFIKKHSLSGKSALRLFFMVQEFMRERLPVIFQIDTRGEESSIPSILNTLSLYQSSGKLQVPFKLVVSRNEGKGVDKEGKNFGKKYSTLSLIADTSDEGFRQLEESINGYLSLPTVKPIEKMIAISPYNFRTPERYFPSESSVQKSN